MMMLALAFTVQVFAQNSASKTKVTVNSGSITVANLIREIEKQTDYLLVYNENEVNLGQRVSVSANDESAVAVLGKALSQAGITPVVQGRNILLKAVAEAPVKDVKGVIVDENGAPVPGATVMVKGTTVGAYTDANGAYSIQAPENAVLVFSCLGYNEQEIAVGNRRQINVAMTTDTQMLDDVIVIGYGTAKKRDYIGSVASLKAEDIAKTAPTSVESVLQGMASGVQVNSGVGVPGAPQQVKVRGVSSISSGTDPLWIVDGIPVQSSVMDQTSDGETSQSILAMLNPNDIESVQVLKDAAATAIYGSRGSNGVILVTTKSGQSGAPKVTVDMRTGVTTWAHSDIGLANTEEWFKIADTAMKNYAGLSSYDVAMTFGNLDGSPTTMTTAEAHQVNTDWVDQISRVGSFYEANVAISQGTDKSNSYVSLKYRKDNGNIKYNEMETFGANVKLGYKLFDFIDLSYRLAATYTDNDRIMSSDGKNGSGGWAQINSNALPWYKVYDENGSNGYWNSLAAINPLASLDPVNTTSNLRTIDIVSNLGATIKLPVDGLTLRGEWGLNYVNSHTQSWRSQYVRIDGAIARERKRDITISNYNAYLNYDKTFADIHNVNVTAGVENTRRSGYVTELLATGLVGQFKEVGAPGNLGGSSGFGNEEYLRGYFLRANYKLMDRYIFNASARRDGISKFTADNRWANFFSFGAGWIISDEKWFDVPAVSLLKLRASLGQTGNTNIPSGITSDSWEVVNSTSNTLEKLATSRLYSIGNADIKWETTNSYDAGIDYGFLNNRINGSIAYYRQNVSDMLLAVSMPVSAGIRGGNICWANVGDMYNQGIEFDINANVMQRRDFSWNVGFNISYNTNKITALDPASDASGAGILNDGEAGQIYTIMKKGHSYGTYYMAEYAGVDVQKGIPMIYEIETDANGETKHTGNIIPGTSENIAQNQMILDGKSALPKFVGGFNTSLTWKNFDLSAVFSFVTGNYIYSRLIMSTFTPNQGMLVMNKKLLTDSWQNPGDKTDVPQINAACVYYYDNEGNPTTTGVSYGTENKTPTTRFLEKGDFLKLRNLTIGYNLPAKIAAKAKLSGARFYVQGTNLFTLTGFSGYDPEIAIDQATGSVVETFTAMPSTRAFIFGVNLNF